jgi:hypothetical protein
MTAIIINIHSLPKFKDGTFSQAGLFGCVKQKSAGGALLYGSGGIT